MLVLEKVDPPISKISKNLDKSFNTEKVTKEFYEDFKSNHFDFQKHISGIRRLR